MMGGCRLAWNYGWWWESYNSFRKQDDYCAQLCIRHMHHTSERCTIQNRKSQDKYFLFQLNLYSNLHAFHVYMSGICQRVTDIHPYEQFITLPWGQRRDGIKRNDLYFNMAHSSQLPWRNIKKNIPKWICAFITKHNEMFVRYS